MLNNAHVILHKIEQPKLPFQSFVFSITDFGDNIYLYNLPEIKLLQIRIV